MIDFKKEVAIKCVSLIKKGQVIGLGAGTTIAKLIDQLQTDEELCVSLTFVSSSFKTRLYLLEKGLNLGTNTSNKSIDIYFDGCDCFDANLNALKSGGGIHTSEKIMAAYAKEFILIGDERKLVTIFPEKVPLVLEILPEALNMIKEKIKHLYPESDFVLRMSNQKDGALISDNGNMLADLYFPVYPNLAQLNSNVKLLPGLVEHSLFYQLAKMAIIAGEKGIKIITP
jgi:ribose 5-phosphate isomerase A